MPVFLRIVVFLVLLLPIAASAAGDDWQVSKATRQVKYTTDRSNWIDLSAGNTVPNHAWISTGPRGRLQLIRGSESITFQPNTMASINTTRGLFSPRKTEVLQQVGQIDLEIEKRSRPHTSVQTPYLAAVVKGTVFRVTVTKTKASVTVDRGLVQVTSFASGQRSDVGSGQSATVDRATGMRVAGQFSKPSIRSVTPSVAALPAVGTTTLSGQTDTGDENKASSGQGTSTTDSRHAGKKNGGDENAKSGGKRNGNKAGGSGNSGNGNGGGHKSGNNGNGNGDRGNGNGGNGGGHEKGDSGNGKSDHGNGNGDRGNGNNGNGNGGGHEKGNGGDGNNGNGNSGGHGNSGNGNGN